MEPTPEMFLVIGVLVTTIVLFVTEVVRIDVAAILVMVALGLLGLVEPGQLFAGFSSNAVISIIAVMIIGSALDRVGVMQVVAGWLLKVGGNTERKILASSSLAVGGISAFMQNIGAAALFLPVIERISDRTKTPVSRLLMPMGFAAILGGTLTLVASGPLILLNDLMGASAANLGVDFEPFSIFAPTPVGLALLLAGIAMFAIGGSWLLPSTTGEASTKSTLPAVTARYGLDGRLHSFLVTDACRLAERTVGEIEHEYHGLFIAAVQPRGGEAAIAPHRDKVIQAGSAIALAGDEPLIEDFVRSMALEPLSGGRDPFAELVNPELAGLVEVSVRPGSDAVGQKVGDVRLRVRFGMTLLAVLHKGEVRTEDLREHVLGAGDVLVLFGPWEQMRDIAADPAYVVITDYPGEPPRTNKRWWAIGALVLALTLTIAFNMQLSLAMMLGAVVVLLSKVLTPDEAYRAVSWKTVFLLAALIPLGTAVETSGTAAWIAGGVANAVQDLPSWVQLASIGLLTTVFTLVVSNIGATVLLIPLAANVAVGVGAEPAAYAMMVALAASNAFLLPTHQVNALLMGPGGYKVVDYVKAGTVMSVLFLVISVPMVMLLWG